MKNRFPLFAASAVTLLCCVSSCGSREEAPRAVETLEPYELGETEKIHSLGDILLASQPPPADFTTAEERGVKTVINLRHHEETEDFDEEAAVTEKGMNYVNLPWNGADELTDEIFDKSRDLLNSSEKPILLHCSSSNRVGAVLIPWRVLDAGIGVEEAVVEATRAGLKNAEYEKKARNYIRRRKQESNQP